MPLRLDRPMSDIPGITDATRVAVGVGFACASTLSHGVMCWGSSDGARLGERTGAATLAAATVPGSESWVANSLARGEIGNGGALAETFARPVQVSGITNAIGLTSNNQQGNSIPSLMIDDAHYHRCALLNTPRDSVVCWGSNSHLQLGDALGPRAAPGPTGTDP